MRVKRWKSVVDRRALKLSILGLICTLSAYGASMQYGERERPEALAEDRMRGHQVAQAPRPAPDEDSCLKCHSQSSGRAAEVVMLHRASTHGKSNIGCADCHGGDASQTDKAKAHSENFVAKPDANGTLVMCGNCHRTQLSQFKTSRHFQARKEQARLDCADCHGTHSVGNPPETFSFIQYCAGCHGLEYLPELPIQFQDLLTLVDEVRDGFVVLAAKGRKPSEELIKQRRELRRRTADLVHPTDRTGGVQRIPQILLQGEKLKRQIQSDQQR